MSDIRKTLDKLNEMTAGSVATVATPLFKETVKREKTDETADSGKKYMNSVERGASEWGNWAGSKKKKTVAEATTPTTDDDKLRTMLQTVTSKKAVNKQKKADTKQKASDAFASMFGGGNPAGTLGIRKEGVEEGLDFRELLKSKQGDKLITNVPKFLFHATPSKNVDSIKSKGLELRSDNPQDKYEPRIYVANNFVDALKISNQLRQALKSKQDYTILKINTNGLKNNFYVDPYYSGGAYTDQNISPDSISVEFEIPKEAFSTKKNWAQFWNWKVWNKEEPSFIKQGVEEGWKEKVAGAALAAAAMGAFGNADAKASHTTGDEFSTPIAGWSTKTDKAGNTTDRYQAGPIDMTATRNAQGQRVHSGGTYQVNKTAAVNVDVPYKDGQKGIATTVGRAANPSDLDHLMSADAVAKRKGVDPKAFARFQQGVEEGFEKNDQPLFFKLSKNGAFDVYKNSPNGPYRVGSITHEKNGLWYGSISQGSMEPLIQFQDKNLETVKKKMINAVKNLQLKTAIKLSEMPKQGVAEGTEPKLGTVKANLMNTKEPTVQVQVYKHNTLRGDSYWVTKEVKKFKTMNQAQAYVDRINKQGVVEGSHDKKSTVTTFVIGCDWNKVVEWLEKNIGQTTLKSPNHINGWYGQGWALFLNPSRYEPGKLAFQVRANTDLSEEELKSQIEMFSKAVVEGDNQINELSPATVLRYAKAVAADAQKHDIDPTKRSAEKRNQSVVGFSRALNRLPKVSFFNKEQDVEESWKISTPIDKERYTDMSDQGLEGPFRLKSGKIVYYDPKEGKYYDRDTDMYMDYDEYQSHTNEEELMELGYEGNIGAMEMVKFFKMADPRQKEILNQLIKEKEFQRAWALIQGVTGDKLVGKEFSEGEIAEQLSEDLRAWFGKGGEGGAGGGGWDRYNTKGERIGKCGERKAGEGKPKCLSKEKAASLRASGGKKAIAAAVRKKRREDPNPQRQGKADMVSNKTKNESLEYYVKEGICPQCNGEMVSEALFTEGKKDACYHKVKSRYKIWPSAYASGALVKCRKVGAKNWGNKSKNESINEGRADDLERALMQARKITKGISYDNTVNEIMVEIEELIKTYNLDMDDFNYHNSRVYEAKHELESAIYGLDEIFEDALRDAQYSDEEGLNEQDLIVMPGKMRMRGDVVKAKRMEPDHEVSMAVNSLLSTIKNAMSLAKIIKGRSEGQGLPGWVSDHITRADELIKDVAEYMEGHEAQKNMLEGKKNVKR